MHAFSCELLSAEWKPIYWQGEWWDNWVHFQLTASFRSSLKLRDRTPWSHHRGLQLHLCHLPVHPRSFRYSTTNTYLHIYPSIKKMFSAISNTISALGMGPEGGEQPPEVKNNTKPHAKWDLRLNVPQNLPAKLEGREHPEILFRLDFTTRGRTDGYTSFNFHTENGTNINFHISFRPNQTVHAARWYEGAWD
ncbi:hypothetical protein VTL71DRAFT_2903 [Oculimacula yallundae]|uniref:Galectin n=1 Tax=Oculimacula yallundae TaxID=86028 RepID=A0ABR4C5P0_9HELO